ncbi:helix-turn-helix domain-containing protein [Rhizobium sp. C4]|uniref:helix-turn-helix domain-containing protein n=1 Tax=Rhizobium sp. C4 TaxID=1349800 RepID=UPI001E28A03D|nr:helix-turn-helix domain-containing protein [Rhizobium sp. C4]MCD2175042.1 helix-turn-helix domain-containing protein [Rhizobium sp. C4]
MQIKKKTPNPIDVYVGSRIRLRRNMLGLSQEKLAEGLGVTFQQVQKYEKGSNRVGASRLQAVSNILNVPVSFFFDDGPKALAEGSVPAERGVEPDELISFVSSKEGLALNRAFAKVTDAKVRAKLLNLVKALAADDDQG